MIKTALILEALVTVRPVLAWKRAFKKPPAVPSATLRPVVELCPGYRTFTTPSQINAYAEAWFERRTEAGEALRVEIDSHNAALAPTVRPLPPVPAHLDLGGRLSPL